MVGVVETKWDFYKMLLHRGALQTVLLAELTFHCLVMLLKGLLAFLNTFTAGNNLPPLLRHLRIRAQAALMSVNFLEAPVYKLENFDVFMLVCDICILFFYGFLSFRPDLCPQCGKQSKGQCTGPKTEVGDILPGSGSR